MTKIGKAIERSSLGTKGAKAKRQTVERTEASKIVAAAAARTNLRSVGGKRA